MRLENFKYITRKKKVGRPSKKELVSLSILNSIWVNEGYEKRAEKAIMHAALYGKGIIKVDYPKV